MKHTITVYTQNHCQQCDATKRRLNSKEIDYTVVDMDADKTGIKERLIAQGYKSAPIVKVDDENGDMIDSWAGFQPTKIDRWTK